MLWILVAVFLILWMLQYSLSIGVPFVVLLLTVGVIYLAINFVRRKQRMA